ncbi:carbohydrate ABC transporter membrane protein 1 (CUT1 family) [Neobacillus bataviensis]|uniref:Carbohydrate ABC transporter membrane protein 1 (CUT1 family) n=1 Tax=Neobacillus bataviensis TaxID=220685 RepID=A0A561DCQ7_9BACI|nr:sugar ABC transporter permease [Neobacillus bataviensis]TWE01185.1 carbohydrate ABC transporter membrane protein 1 (CUT1 family) [Neobacillus bataviensis]
METIVRKGESQVKYKRNSHMTYERQQKVLGVLFSLPALVLLFTFLILPVALAFVYSFMNYNMLNPDEKVFTGLDNYVRLFKDAIFFTALKNTVYFTALVVPLQCGVALFLAILVNKKVKVASLGRVFFFSPVVTSMVVVAILWTFLYNVDNGLINHTLNFFGIKNQPFLLSPNQAMNSIIFMSIWQAAGFQMMIFLAGLKDVPEELYEAAEIDGANVWQKFRNVTLPSIQHVTGFVLIITTIQAFRLFIQPYVMTNGGPSDSTKTLVFMLYENGFQFRDVGYSSAIAVVFFLVVLITSMVLKKLLKQ